MGPNPTQYILTIIKQQIKLQVLNHSYYSSHFLNAPPSPFSVVFEHIKPYEKSCEFLLELLTQINIPTHALK